VNQRLRHIAASLLIITAVLFVIGVNSEDNIEATEVTEASRDGDTAEAGHDEAAESEESRTDESAETGEAGHDESAEETILS
jgi:hypothetical protein